MKVSVIIPVWNGAAVITKCLEALFENSAPGFHEVICVDNASTDESPSLISASFPQVRLLRQPVNLGFAGGVNAGIEAAEGDALILLNQDCIVQPGWLASLLQVLDSSSRVILGCLILNEKGEVDHAGAKIQRPEAYGVHLTELMAYYPYPVEYVSGASFAFHRKVWETVGKLDEGFYPAYYEDIDYCFRARRKGVNILCVPQARVVHLRSSKEWRVDPMRHWANSHTVRYRFVCKHFYEHELQQFFEAERASLQESTSLEEVLGRIIAARRILFSLPELVMRRRHDLGEELSSAFVRQIQVGLGTVLQEALAQLDRLEPVAFQPLQNLTTSLQNLIASLQSLQSIQHQEYSLLQRIYFRSPLDQNPEPWFKRLFRLFVLRPFSFLVGRDYLLLAELNTLHTARMDRMGQVMNQMGQVMNQMGQVMNQMGQVMNQVRQRIKLLETMIRYEGP